MSVEDGWRNHVKLFGVESLNSVDRWRYDMDRLEQERARAKEQMKRDEERHARSLARAGAREEIASLRGELAELRGEFETLSSTLADCLRATSETFSTLSDEAHARREEVADLKLAVARLGASPEAKRAFQFAREKGAGEIVDLPEFLIRKAH